MKVKRKIIEINEGLCDGCGQCVPSCAEGAIQIIDGKARLVAEKYCDGLGACLGECPNGAIKIIEREAEDFDAEAVEGYILQKDIKDKKKQEEQEKQKEGKPLPCGCPSTYVESFEQPGSCQQSKASVRQKRTVSGLSHWPVQIKLVPPSAPFLKGADLLVLSDCAAVTYPNLHEDFLKNRAVMMGCPKFDNVAEYVQKFTVIFTKAEIKKITLLMMEVPCCSGLAGIIERALHAAGKKVPIETIILSTRGEIL